MLICIILYTKSLLCCTYRSDYLLVYICVPYSLKILRAQIFDGFLINLKAYFYPQFLVKIQEMRNGVAIAITFNVVHNMQLCEAFNKMLYS